MTAFPDGLITRGATRDEAPLVTDLWRAAEAVDAGESEVTLEDVLSDWERPGFDPATDTILVIDADHPVAAAEVWGTRADAAVLPDARGRGIGASLLSWIEERAREAAAPRIGQTIPDTNERAAGLFARQSYTPRHTSLTLELPQDVRIEHPPLPSGMEIRPFDPGHEEYEVYRLLEDAFREWPGRVPGTLEFWHTQTAARKDFDPSLLFVAVDAGMIVGAASCIPYLEVGWVQQLAVRRSHRGRGLGKALLRTAFEEFRRRGQTSVGLSTDSRTGALDLYLHVGMEVRRTYTHYAKDLLP